MRGVITDTGLVEVDVSSTILVVFPKLCSQSYRAYQVSGGPKFSLTVCVFPFYVSACEECGVRDV